ncbi:MAG: phosphopyruvate hydratase [Nanoarchaeota archaeon]|nr:phosphopyruvate hydratase [Nanoarchaeota archaeon]
MVKIQTGVARQVLDSRGNPTVEVTLKSAKYTVSAIVPSGASTGIHEALELRDHKTAYGGKSVLKAVNNINKKIIPAIRNKQFSSQKDLDRFLLEIDGTVQKARLGENAILAVSMAYSRLEAQNNNKPLYKQLADDFGNKNVQLPIPFSNVINGGVHAGNELEMQEFMIAPIKAKSFSQATQIVSETYHILKGIIVKKYGKNAANVGDEGGFAPPIATAAQALDLLSKAIEESGYKKELRIAMDPASSEYYNKKSHTYLKKKLSPPKMQSQYESLIKKYPIISLEDPFEQDDFESWKAFTKRNGKKLQIVGDDLTVTNPTRVQLAADQKLCNALLLKINQIGTITESLTSASIAKANKWNVMVSHRSGETEDPYIADLSAGLGMGQIKIGAPCRSDRVAKYNQLLRIEEELGRKAKYSRW